MLKNLKHSIVFILIVITLLFVVVMSLAASKPVPNISTAAVSAQNGNESKYGKWSGLGMGLSSTKNTSEFDSYLDTLLANGFTEIRIEFETWNAPEGVARTKAAAVRAVTKGANVIWGLDQWNGGGSYPPITAANWGAYRTAIKAAAQWAQDNGVFEFQIGNEEELHIDDDTLKVPQLIANLKSLATEVQAIFTNGNVSYSCFHDNISDWVTAGKGDLDILASNVYMTWGARSVALNWEDEIDALVGAFGTGGTYLTEFSLNSSGLGYYSKDEAVQAAAITEMIDYIKASGMTRAFYFSWKDDGKAHFGVVKNDGTYRLLWRQALLNSGSVESATVPK